MTDQGLQHQRQQPRILLAKTSLVLPRPKPDVRERQNIIMEAEKMQHHRWEHPSNMIVAGPTKSGKTVFVRKLIRHSMWKYRPGIKKVVYAYGVWQDSYDEMKREFGSRVKWHRGLPENPYKLFNGKPGLLIIDDLMGEIETQGYKQVSKMFTKGTHHMNVGIILIQQNLFPNNNRSISLNAHYIVLPDNPRDQNQIRHLMRQAFSGQTKWMRRAMNYAYSKPFRPLVLDFCQTTPNNHRMSVDPFPEDLKKSGEPFTQIILPSV